MQHDFVGVYTIVWVRARQGYTAKKKNHKGWERSVNACEILLKYSRSIKVLQLTSNFSSLDRENPIINLKE